MDGAPGFPPANHRMEGPHTAGALDQDSSKDAFLQPQVSHSSPVRHRSKAHGHHLDTVAPAAASADLSDLLHDFHALSARCQASEQQLERTRRELHKERQRSRRLMASYGALTRSNECLGRQLQQHRASLAEPLLHPAGEQPGRSELSGPAQAERGGEHRSSSGSSSSANSDSQPPHDADDSGAQCTQQQQHHPAVGPLSQAMLANSAAGRYHRWSTDTNTRAVDQGSGCSANPAPWAPALQESVPVGRTPAGGSPQGTAAAGTGPVLDIKLAAVDSSLQSLQAAAVAGARQPQPAGAQASGDPRCVQQQGGPQCNVAQASASSSPGSHKHGAPLANSSTSLQHPAAAGGPEHTGAPAVDAAAAAAAAPAGFGEQVSSAGGVQAAQRQQQPRGVSKRPAQHSEDADGEDRQSSRAARRRRPARRSSDSGGSSGSGSSSACQEQQQQPAVDSNTAPTAAAAATPHAATTETGDASGSCGSSTGAAAGASAAGLGSKRERLPPAPVSAPFSSGSAYRPSRLSAASDSSSWAIVPVGTAPSSSRRQPMLQGGACNAAGDSRGGSGRARPAGCAEQEGPTMGCDPPLGHQARPAPASATGASAASVGSSYRQRAAKAAKAVASKLRKLFLGQSSARPGSSSDGHSRASSTAGAGEQGEPREPASSADSSEGLRNSSHSRSRSSTGPGRESDFRRSWQGPFFSSSGAAARAAAHQARAETRASKDDSHAQADSKGGKSSSSSKRWRPPKWARKYYHATGLGSDSDSSSSGDEADDIFNGDPFGPTFSPLRHNFRQRHPEQHSQQGPAAAAGGQNPFADPFGPAFSPLRQSMGLQPSDKQQGGQHGAPAEADGDDGFGPDWLGID